MNYLIFLCVSMLHPSTGQLSLISDLIGGTPCNIDSQCRGFTRGKCTEWEKTIIFFLNSQICKKNKYVKYTVPGRCIKRSNPVCDVGSKLKLSFLISPNNLPFSRCLQRR